MENNLFRKRFFLYLKKNVASVGFVFFMFFLKINCFSQDTIQPQDTVVMCLDSVFPIEIIFKSKPTIKTVYKNLKFDFQTLKKIPAPKVKNWRQKNSLGFDLNQVAFSNWNAGGISAISGLLKGAFSRTRSDLNSEWINELSFRYGLNKQDGIEVRKSDDEFRINSSFGYKTDPLSLWYYSAKFELRSQFTDGFKYPNVEKPISKLFAPAFTFLGVGANYFDRKKNFDVYISPLTLKNTLVLNQELANSGAFGVEPAIKDATGNIIRNGKQSRTEVGFLVTNYFKNDIWKNVTMENKMSLYSDYIHNFGNIDIEWRLQFDLLVNEYIRANIGFHLLFDDDVKSTEIIEGQKVMSSAKIQLRQGIGIGMVYNF